MITQAEIQAKFQYCPHTGQFTRLNKTRRGRLAGTQNSCGYIRIVINRKAYLAHRLAWLYVYGTFPTADTDHINGNRADNRIANLRDVPRKINSTNRHTANKNNVSGLLGVSPLRDRWVAQHAVQGKNRHIGVFDTAEAAHQAYIAAKQA
jgi:hypothetical protein